MLYSLEIMLAHPLLFWGQLHDGVLEQRQLPPHAIVRLRCTEFDELLCHVDDIHPEAVALLQVLHQVATAGDDQAVAGLKAKRLAVTLESAIPLVAIGMAEIVGKRCVADSP